MNLISEKKNWSLTAMQSNLKVKSHYVYLSNTLIIMYFYFIRKRELHIDGENVDFTEKTIDKNIRFIWIIIKLSQRGY